MTTSESPSLSRDDRHLETITSQPFCIGSRNLKEPFAAALWPDKEGVKSPTPRRNGSIIESGFDPERIRNMVEFAGIGQCSSKDRQLRRTITWTTPLPATIHEAALCSLPIDWQCIKQPLTARDVWVSSRFLSVSSCRLLRSQAIDCEESVSLGAMQNFCGSRHIFSRSISVSLLDLAAQRSSYSTLYHSLLKAAVHVQ